MQKLHTDINELMKVARMLYEQGANSQNIVLMCDEMHLQIGAHYHGGISVGADGHRNLFRGIFDFMIVGIKRKYQLLFKQFHVTKLMEI